MKSNYSMEEILNAVNDLQKIKKRKNDLLQKEKVKANYKSNIPKNTLKLIEEAEKSKS
tara:strand:- start:1655 stop:1828 length:174 start_codon:yes stop_codon:yes gene_type:complete